MRIKKCYLPIVRVAIFSLLLVSTTSCIVIGLGLAHGINGIASMIYDKRYDVTEVKKYQYIAGKSFILKQDAFYFRYYDKNEKRLDVSNSSCLPASTDEYERDPKYWLNAHRDGRFPVFGVVKAGTKITIDTVILEIEHLDWFNHELYAHVDEGSLKGSRANVTDLFKNTRGKEEEILPSPDYKKIEEINQNVKFN